MYLHCCLLIGTSTNVGRYKHNTYKRRTVQTSDQYKRRTSTNIGPVQMSDWYKRGTGTFIRKNVGLRRKKISLNFQIIILVNSQFSLKKNSKFFLLKIHNLTKSGYMGEETATCLIQISLNTGLQRRNPTKIITTAFKGKTILVLQEQL